MRESRRRQLEDTATRGRDGPDSIHLAGERQHARDADRGAAAWLAHRLHGDAGPPTPGRSCRGLQVSDSVEDWFDLGDELDAGLVDLDIILMRKDPPVDIDYITATFVLERAEVDGVMVVNRPRALRDVNEKIYTSWFPDCCPAKDCAFKERD